MDEGLGGVVNSLIQEKNEEGCAMIEVRPEGYTDGYVRITLNRRDMRSKFGYTASSAV